MAIAANKFDMYEREEVDEDEAKKFADELNAIFQKTSAKESTGIDDLFLKIGKRFIDPKGEMKTTGQSNASKTGGKSNKKENIKLNEKNTGGKQKKGCC